jgi:hypothetical protein
MAARRCGVKPPDSDAIDKAFPGAYERATEKFPMFGGKDMHSKDWWRHCVIDSLESAGCDMSDEDKEVLALPRHALLPGEAVQLTLHSVPYCTPSHSDTILAA